MHRVLGHHDWQPTKLEVHGSATGVSFGAPHVFDFVNPGGAATGSGKVGETVLLPEGSPMGLGHDAGPLRVHVLVDSSPEQAHVVKSAMATATSGVKPCFSAHKVQVSVSGSMLPVVTDPTPMGVGLLSATYCGTPDSPNVIPLVPSHSEVFAGMTLGDMLGGLVNMIVDALWSIVADKIGDLAGLIMPDWLFGLGTRYCGLLIDGYGLGPSNIGVIAQQWIDGDGIGHDASVSVMGAGFLGELSYDARTGEFEGEWGPAGEYTPHMIAVVGLISPATRPMAMEFLTQEGVGALWE
jgi:hypothetical protein